MVIFRITNVDAFQFQVSTEKNCYIIIYYKDFLV